MSTVEHTAADDFAEAEVLQSMEMDLWFYYLSTQCFCQEMCRLDYLFGGERRYAHYSIGLGPRCYSDVSCGHSWNRFKERQSFFSIFSQIWGRSYIARPKEGASVDALLSLRFDSGTKYVRNIGSFELHYSIHANRSASHISISVHWVDTRRRVDTNSRRTPDSCYHLAQRCH